MDSGGGKFETCDVPRMKAVVERIVRNSTSGVSALDGISLYRGGKDPDIGCGSFSDAFKHGSLIPEVAQGYASNANGAIGFRSPGTDKFGFVAKFQIPHDADDVRFYRNFGIEDASAGYSIKEACRQIDFLVHSSPDPHAAVEKFIVEQMYEARIPARLQPESAWLLEMRGPADEFGVCRREGLDALAAQIAAERGARLICPNLYRLADSLGADAEARDAASELMAYANYIREEILVGDLERTLSRRTQHLRDSGVEFSRLKNTGTAIKSSDAVDSLCVEIMDAMSGSRPVAIEAKISDLSKAKERLALVDKACDLVLVRDSADTQASVMRADVDRASKSMSSISADMDGCRDRIVSLKNELGRTRRNIFSKIYYATIGRPELSRVSQALKSEGDLLSGMAAKMDGLQATRANSYSRLQGFQETSAQSRAELRPVILSLTEFCHASTLKNYNDLRGISKELRGIVKQADLDLSRMHKCGQQVASALWQIQSGELNLRGSDVLRARDDGKNLTSREGLEPRRVSVAP